VVALLSLLAKLLLLKTSQEVFCSRTGWKRQACSLLFLPLSLSSILLKEKEKRKTFAELNEKATA
jgi:hypothetical protein